MLNPLTVHCPTSCAILSGVPSFPGPFPYLSTIDGEDQSIRNEDITFSYEPFFEGVLILGTLIGNYNLPSTNFLSSIPFTSYTTPCC